MTKATGRKAQRAGQEQLRRAAGDGHDREHAEDFGAVRLADEQHGKAQRHQAARAEPEDRGRGGLGRAEMADGDGRAGGGQSGGDGDQPAGQRDMAARPAGRSPSRPRIPRAPRPSATRPSSRRARRRRAGSRRSAPKSRSRSPRPSAASAKARKLRPMATRPMPMRTTWPPTRLVRSEARPGPERDESQRGKRRPELAIEQAFDHADAVLRQPLDPGEHDRERKPGADAQGHAEQHILLGRPVGVAHVAGHHSSPSSAGPA